MFMLAAWSVSSTCSKEMGVDNLFVLQLVIYVLTRPGMRMHVLYAPSNSIVPKNPINFAGSISVSVGRCIVAQEHAGVCRR